MPLTTQRQDSLDGSGIHIKLGLFVYEFIKSLSQIEKKKVLATWERSVQSFHSRYWQQEWWFITQHTFGYLSYVGLFVIWQDNC